MHRKLGYGERRGALGREGLGTSNRGMVSSAETLEVSRGGKKRHLQGRDRDASKYSVHFYFSI